MNDVNRLSVVTLQAVTADNLGQVERLEADEPHATRLVAMNVISLAQAHCAVVSSTVAVDCKPDL